MQLSEKNKAERDIELEVNDSFCKLTKDFIKASDIVLQNFKAKAAFKKFTSDAEIGVFCNEAKIIFNANIPQGYLKFLKKHHGQGRLLVQRFHFQ